MLFQWLALLPCMLVTNLIKITPPWGQYFWDAACSREAFGQDIAFSHNCSMSLIFHVHTLGKEFQHIVLLLWERISKVRLCSQYKHVLVWLLSLLDTVSLDTLFTYFRLRIFHYVGLLITKHPMQRFSTNVSIEFPRCAVKINTYIQVSASRASYLLLAHSRVIADPITLSLSPVLCSCFLHRFMPWL